MKHIFTLASIAMLSTVLSYAQISLTSPIGGELWTSGSTQNITWTCGSCMGTANIDYSSDGGSTWSPIASGVPNSGTYTWNIPSVFTGLSARARIRVTAGMFSDISWANFQISHPNITIVAPNGGESLVVGQSYTITVTSSLTFGGNLEYSTDAGTTWNVITYLSTGFPGTVNYTWTVPDANSNICLVRFNAGAPFQDFSNSYFSIYNKITVTSPNGGENWLIGSSQNITWTFTSGVTNVDIDYSTDGGSTWDIVASFIPSTGSYAWTVPPPASTNCLVRVRDFMIPLVSDTSNATFTISIPPPPSIAVTAPNGGENWAIGSSQNITWNSTGVTYVDIDYSTDGGSTWNSVATNIASSGTYAWTVPSTASTNCLVRVMDSSNPSVGDTSNATFTISISSVIEMEATDEIFIYPNPTHDFITLNIASYKNPEVLIISTVDGKVIKKEIISAENHVINLQELPAGIYILNLRDSYKKLIKQ